MNMTDVQLMNLVWDHNSSLCGLCRHSQQVKLANMRWHRKSYWSIKLLNENSSREINLSHFHFFPLYLTTQHHTDSDLSNFIFQISCLSNDLKCIKFIFPRNTVPVVHLLQLAKQLYCSRGRLLSFLEEISFIRSGMLKRNNCMNSKRKTSCFALFCWIIFLIGKSWLDIDMKVYTLFFQERNQKWSWHLHSYPLVSSY